MFLTHFIQITFACLVILVLHMDAGCPYNNSKGSPSNTILKDSLDCRPTETESILQSQLSYTGLCFS